MQPYFFPYIGYWQLINAVDRYVIYDDVAYIKNGWINRNNILLNSQKYLITLPLDGASPFSAINETRITSNAVVKDKLLKTIDLAYRKSPFFDRVFPIIENTVRYEDGNIAHAITFSINQICRYLDIDTEILVSSDLQKSCDLKAQDKVIHIVKLLGGDEYMNAIGGQELYSENDFAKEGISLKFLKTGCVEYKQFRNNFTPNLSIIDIMMFNSPQAIREILNNYELV
jgi:hypothetical protein